MNQENQKDHKKEYRKGYVNGLFRIFHLKEIPDQDIPVHFHDFRKIVILLQGSLFYEVEGSRYELEPGDMVLVDAGELHRPVLPKSDNASYERIIIYLSDELFAMHKEAELDSCFYMLKKGFSHVIQGKAMGKDNFRRWTKKLADPFSGNSAAGQLMQECRLIEFLLELNHAMENQKPLFREPITGNPMVQQVMQFLSEHLTEVMEIEQVATHVHLHPSYLMHMFKEETGSSIMGYLTEKRLFTAQNLIREGMPAMNAAERSGFSNYTSFYRAYRKRYGTSPGKTKEMTTDAWKE